MGPRCFFTSEIAVAPLLSADAHPHASRTTSKQPLEPQKRTREAASNICNVATGKAPCCSHMVLVRAVLCAGCFLWGQALVGLAAPTRIKPFCKEQHQALSQAARCLKAVLYVLRPEQFSFLLVSFVFSTLFAYYFCKGRRGGSISVGPAACNYAAKTNRKKAFWDLLGGSGADRRRCKIAFSVHLSMCVRQKQQVSIKLL